MNIKKYGETFNITSENENYKLSGDIIKTVQGNVVINVNTTNNSGDFISTMNGDYFVTDNTFNFNFRTKVDAPEQLEIIQLVTDAVKEILKETV